MSKRVSIACAAVAAALVGLSSPAAAKGKPELVLEALEKEKKPHVADELLIMFREGATEQSRQTVRRMLAAKTKEVVKEERGKRL